MPRYSEGGVSQTTETASLRLRLARPSLSQTGLLRQERGHEKLIPELPAKLRD